MFNFQQIILRLHQFWADQGCVIWQPHNSQVGAGTSNPATILRALGPEPWRVAYQEPSARPADGRYGENPNRWYEYYQYQVILKPAPANNIDLYLASLQAIGIDSRQHDIRFVEDNWESPSLGAWGLGWEIWLDGLEVSQYTYFQQLSGIDANPVSVEITYGLERLALFLQGVPAIADITWLTDLTYRDVHLADEIDYCTYNFDEANVARLHQMYQLFAAESQAALTKGLVLPAHDYLLRCSHTFNVLDARGAIGVTQRAQFFRQMRELSHQIALAYLKQREALGYPFMARKLFQPVAIEEAPPAPPVAPVLAAADLLFEIGVEELPASDVSLAVAQLRAMVPRLFADARLSYQHLRIGATPRRLVVYVEALAPTQAPKRRTVKGPAVALAYDAEGNATKAAEGFSRSVGIPLSELVTEEIGGKQHLVAQITEPGRPTTEVLVDLLPAVISALTFERSMRWNATQVTFARPIRWIVALLGEVVIAVQYAGVQAGRVSYGPRPLGSPPITLATATDYAAAMAQVNVMVDIDHRRSAIQQQIAALAHAVGGVAVASDELLAEVTNLVEHPVAIRGTFNPAFLSLPKEVLSTVMQSHQRYFPVADGAQLVPYFITVANGMAAQTDTVGRGNEAVIMARFADARFFYETDTRRPLESFLPQLSGLVFHEKLGSYLDKTERLKQLVPKIGTRAGLTPSEHEVALRAATLAKADLVTGMVVEFTELQGIMGRYYALHAGEPEPVAMAIAEQYLPRSAEDTLPTSRVGSIIGIADRIDSLVGLFAVGLKPTGTANQFGLRRAALGLVQLLIHHQLPLSLQALVQEAASLFGLAPSDPVVAEVRSYLQRRLQNLLLDHGYRYDSVEAVLAARGDTPALAFETVRDLNTHLQQPAFGAMLSAYARAARIVRKVNVVYAVDPELLQADAERDLYQASTLVSATLSPASSVTALINALAVVAEPINRLFDTVLVMDQNVALRHNRLGLLQHIVALADGIVDFSRLEGF